MKIKLILLVAFSFFVSVSYSQEDYEISDTSKYYSFHINYWFNMHHFLWLEAFVDSELDSSLVSDKLSSEIEDEFKNAVTYYKNNLVQKDLRMSDYMTGFKEWVTGANFDINKCPSEFSEHVQVLQKFNKVYENEFWLKHKNACLEALYGNKEMILKIEDEYVDKITNLTRQFWPFEKVRVDVVVYAKSSKWNLRNRPYTSIFPTHVVMNAIGENEIPGNWIELLFHESAHPLILGSSYFVSGTISDVAEAKGLKIPRQLWHAYLFYFTGHAAKELLIKNGIDYPSTYMERNRVFSKYLPALQKYLDSYIERKMTLAEATEKIINELNN